jgi:hypothetical protein
LRGIFSVGAMRLEIRSGVTNRKRHLTNLPTV